MTGEPWLGDACSLVDALRAGTTHPPRRSRGRWPRSRRRPQRLEPRRRGPRTGGRNAADVSLPFGGVPVAIKELDPVAGWPQTVRVAGLQGPRLSTYDAPCRATARAGAVLVGQTTASEFGVHQLHAHAAPRRDAQPVATSSERRAARRAARRRRWRADSSLVSGGDGGGSIRIPAGFTGLFGLKSTFGRIPKGPCAEQTPLTVVSGASRRSVRDTARWFDVCNGSTSATPSACRASRGWEAGLGSSGPAGQAGGGRHGPGRSHRHRRGPYQG